MNFLCLLRAEAKQGARPEKQGVVLDFLFFFT